MGLDQNKSNFERFIGENLIGKIGIVITLIGVAIGIKFLFQEWFVSDIAIQLLVYSIATLLGATALWIKKKYESLSATLFSGGIATFFIQTYLSFDLFHSLSQSLAFAILISITLIAIAGALWYNQQIVAHIGIVGAYLIPFLVSNGNENHLFFFSYLSVVNGALLFLTFKKNWKALCITSLVFTYLMLGVWNEQYGSVVAIQWVWNAFWFSCIQYVLLHLSFFIQERRFGSASGVLAILLFCGNSVAFMVLFTALDNSSTDLDYGFLFIGILNITLASVALRRNLIAKEVNNALGIIGLASLTLFIPSHFNGVNAAFAILIESLGLLFIAKKFRLDFLIIGTFVAHFIGFFTLLFQVGSIHDGWDASTLPFLNYNAIMFIGASLVLFIIYFYARKILDTTDSGISKSILRITLYTAPILGFILLQAFSMAEIGSYYQAQFDLSSSKAMIAGYEVPVSMTNSRLFIYESIWQFNLLLTLWALIFIGKRYISRESSFALHLIITIFFFFHIMVMLGFAFWQLNKLRIEAFHYFHNKVEGFEPAFPPSWYDVQLRYIFLGFLSLTLVALYRFTQHPKLNYVLSLFNKLLIHLAILWTLASETVGWSVLFTDNPSYRFGLSVVLSCYAFFMVALGIRKAKKYLRFSGMILFAFSLLKLFSFDIWTLNTLAKTIAFISLGLLMLLVSFLYGKYKTKLFGNEE